jgi:selenocysteine lyase/cysteine desulfurase
VMTAPPPTALARWRADTPGCSSRVHLNNAGAALTPRVVHQAVTAHLSLEDELGGYEAAEARVGALRQVYQSLGRLIGAEARNLALVQSSTLAFAQALLAFDFAPGDTILTSRADYASNQIMYLSLARWRGVEIIRAPDAAEGGIDPDAVRSLVAQRRPTLVALTWVPTNSGLVQPAPAVGEICRAAEVPYLVDACQAVGQMTVEVGALHCDYLAATSRKFLRGPRGVGFLYVSDRALAAGAHPLLVDMHGASWTDPDAFALTPDGRRFESWEMPYALVLGFGAAVDYALEVGIPAAQERAWALAAYARERLARVAGVRVLDRGPALCAIVTIEPAGREGAEVKLALRARGINTSSPSREDVKEIDAAAAALEELLSSGLPS